MVPPFIPGEVRRLKIIILVLDKKNWKLSIFPSQSEMPSPTMGMRSGQTKSSVITKCEYTQEKPDFALPTLFKKAKLSFQPKMLSKNVKKNRKKSMFLNQWEILSLLLSISDMHINRLLTNAEIIWAKPTVVTWITRTKNVGPTCSWKELKQLHVSKLILVWELVKPSWVRQPGQVWICNGKQTSP